jgi:hypothetical protein
MYLKRSNLSLNKRRYLTESGVLRICRLEAYPIDLFLIDSDLRPEAPSFITGVCGFGFCIFRFRFGQARRARSPQISQALGALQRVFCCPEMSAV